MIIPVQKFKVQSSRLRSNRSKIQPTRPTLNPNSAVPADAMSEEQTFRSERSLSLRLIRLRRKWVSAEPAFKVGTGAMTLNLEP
jgi:hypothetical protein